MQRSLAHPWAAVVTSVKLIRSLSVLIQSYITNIHTTVYVYTYLFCVCFLVWVYTTAVLPNTLFLLDAGNFIWTGTSCRSCHPTFLPGFHRSSECVFLVDVSRVLYLSESVEFVSVCVRRVHITYMTAVWLKGLSLHRTSVLLIQASGHTNLCTQTNRHSGWISEMVDLFRVLFFQWKHSRMYVSLMCMNVSVFCWACTTPESAHTRTHAEITRTPLSCGGTECDADSLSLLIQAYIHTYHWCMCEYIYLFFVCLLFWVYTTAFLSNCLFLVDTGSFIYRTTSCLPCHPTFSPVFHHFSECVCF